MERKVLNKNLVIFQGKSGAIELKGDFRAETIWATQAQIAEIFGIERSVVTKHIRNIFKDKELDQVSVCAKFAHTADDGKTYQVQFYNLDIILSVGYRVNSLKAIDFRQWATKTLRAHIVDGYTINRSRIAQNYTAFMQAVTDVRALLPAGAESDTDSILELISIFADTWMSLDAYDKDTLDVKKATKKKVRFTAQKLAGDISLLKKDLMQKKEATDIFAVERQKGALEGIVGNIMQSFDGQEVYPTLEEKAAHLLYFIVKNHPFIDGNKRSGAYSFVWLLRRAGLLNIARITPTALTALTLLIAQSDAKEKNKMISLVIALLSSQK